ncbi:DUF2267 domain-containing protein [Saccharomonospora sp.]|uniref:DUF2267 domain-containing protein n=1 Tax=Saccharomonospora sp. TaxID=33913 RepID=UPI0026167FEE|nr:DUF2267 domain-containing protein [Saccharomonospora sp.]
MKYQNLVESVQDRTLLDNSENAREAVEAVLTTLAHCVTPDARTQLAEHLPGSLEQTMEVPGETEIRDSNALLIEIAHRLDSTPEHARYVGQAVIDSLRTEDPGLVDELRGELHSDLLAVLEPAGEPPHRARSVDPGVPTELSDADVEQALRRLPEWTGDHSGIRRTVVLPQDRHIPLVNGVQTEARKTNDHVRVDQDGDSVTFTLNTGREGVVTEPDLELAERIDRVVAEVGSGGRPG